MVAANKVDSPVRPRWPPTSTRSAWGSPIAVSATQGLGTGDLLDA